MPLNRSTIGTIALLIATVFWGMTFAFIKGAIASLSPYNFLFWRFFIASLLLLILFFPKLKFNKTTLIQGLWLGIFLGGTVIFQTVGLQYTTASIASFITGFSVILVPLFVAIQNKKWPSSYVIISALLAIVGIGCISLENGLKISLGEFWILLCAISFAFYMIVVEKFSHKDKTIPLTLIQFLFICLVSLALCQPATGIDIPQHFHEWAAIIFCSVFASVIAFMLQLHYQSYVSSNKAAIIFSLEPVFATITAAIYLHEHLTINFFIGAFLILLAIYLSEKSAKQKHLPQE